MALENMFSDDVDHAVVGRRRQRGRGGSMMTTTSLTNFVLGVNNVTEITNIQSC